MGCLSGDSAHLPTLKHFNHLTPNYFGAEQNRTESHTSFLPRSQMVLQARSTFPVFIYYLFSHLAHLHSGMDEKASSKHTQSVKHTMKNERIVCSCSLVADLSDDFAVKYIPKRR